MGFQHHTPVKVWSCQFVPEDGRHGRWEGCTEVEFVHAEESFLQVHDSVVVAHGQDEAAGEGVTVDERYRWHGEPIPKASRSETFQLGLASKVGSIDVRQQSPHQSPE